MSWFSRQAMAVCIVLVALLTAMAIMAVTAGQRTGREWLALAVAGLVVVVMVVRWAGQSAVWVRRGRCCRPLRPGLDRRRIDHITVAHAPLSRWIPDHRVVVVPTQGRELWVLPSLDAFATLARGRQLARELGVPFQNPALLDPDHD